MIYVPDFAAEVDDSISVLDFGTVQTYLNAADIVLTFNGEHFDFAVLEGAGFDMSHAREVSYDLMAKFVDATKHRISLKDFAKALGVMEKTGSGENTVQLWQAANMLIETPPHPVAFHDVLGPTEREASNAAGAKHLYGAVIDYCLDDVKITRECYNALVDFNGRMQYWQKFKRQYAEIRMALPEGVGTFDSPYIGWRITPNDVPLPPVEAPERDPSDTLNFTNTKGESHDVPF